MRSTSFWTLLSSRCWKHCCWFVVWFVMHAVSHRPGGLATLQIINCTTTKGSDRHGIRQPASASSSTEGICKIKLSQYRAIPITIAIAVQAGTSAYNLLARLHRSLRIETGPSETPSVSSDLSEDQDGRSTGAVVFVLASRQSLQLGLERLARRFYSFFHNQNLWPGP